MSGSLLKKLIAVSFLVVALRAIATCSLVITSGGSSVNDAGVKDAGDVRIRREAEPHYGQHWSYYHYRPHYPNYVGYGISHSNAHAHAHAHSSSNGIGIGHHGSSASASASASSSSSGHHRPILG